MDADEEWTSCVKPKKVKKKPEAELSAPRQNAHTGTREKRDSKSNNNTTNNTRKNRNRRGPAAPAKVRAAAADSKEKAIQPPKQQQQQHTVSNEGKKEVDKPEEHTVRQQTPVSPPPQPLSLGDFLSLCLHAEALTISSSRSSSTSRRSKQKQQQQPQQHHPAVAEARVARGLTNRGNNTCFRNATMQCLFAAPPFSEVMAGILRTLSHPSLIPPEYQAWGEVLRLAWNLLLYRNVNPNPNLDVVETAGEASSSLSSSLSSSSSSLAAARVAVGPAIELDQLMPGITSLFRRTTRGISITPNTPIRGVMGTTTQQQLQQQRHQDEHIGATMIGAGAAAERSRSIDDRQQEDAMEFLSFLLDLLHEEEAAAANTITNGSSGSSAAGAGAGAAAGAAAGAGAGNDSESVLEASTDTSGIYIYSNSEDNEDEEEEEEEEAAGEWEVVVKANVRTSVNESALQVSKEAKTLISRMFHIRVRSTLHYVGKKKVSSTFAAERFLNLNVRGLPSGVPRTVQGALGAYFSEEHVAPVGAQYYPPGGSTGGYSYPPGGGGNGCRNNHRSPGMGTGKSDSEYAKRKKCTLETLPRVLLLQLNRFYYDEDRQCVVKDAHGLAYTSQLGIKESYVLYYTLVRPSFLASDVSLSSIYCCLLAFSDTTWHESNHPPPQPIDQSTPNSQYLLP
jgi:hypothetical protein